MELCLLVRVWRMACTIDGHWMKCHATDPGDSSFILLHLSDGGVFVGVDSESCAVCQEKERKRVATRDGGHEGLLGIDVCGVAVGERDICG